MYYISYQIFKKGKQISILVCAVYFYSRKNIEWNLKKELPPCKYKFDLLCREAATEMSESERKKSSEMQKIKSL
jgi:hypothetical protein